MTAEEVKRIIIKKEEQLFYKQVLFIGNLCK